MSGRFSSQIHKETVCLQPVDYLLWALQRFYEVRRYPATNKEIREDRFLSMLWPQTAEVHDLNRHFVTRKDERRMDTLGRKYNAPAPLQRFHGFGNGVLTPFLSRALL
jgi:hypothetical protein